MVDMFPIQLPEFLEAADGDVRITGHRINLHDVLWEYNQGRTVEELVLRFPTVKRSTLHKLVAFYLDNQTATDNYLKAVSSALGNQRASAQPAISVAELERRLEHIRRTALNAAQVSH